jgi:hypothetical protein
LTADEENWLPPKVAAGALVIIACHLMCFSFLYPKQNSWHHNGHPSRKEIAAPEYIAKHFWPSSHQVCLLTIQERVYYTRDAL